MNKFIDRAKVVLAAAVTWIVVASTIVTILAEEISAVVAEGTAATVTRVALRIVSVLGAAVAIIRRVTPVLPSQRGIL